MRVFTENYQNYLRNNMKCQISKIMKHNFRIRKLDDNNSSGKWLLIDIPEEVYEEIRNKLHDRPYTGIHGEIMKLMRVQGLPSEVVLDYIYRNVFDYLFE